MLRASDLYRFERYAPLLLGALLCGTACNLSDPLSESEATDARDSSTGDTTTVDGRVEPPADTRSGDSADDRDDAIVDSRALRDTTDPTNDDTSDADTVDASETCTPTPEECNETDDDCDGTADEGCSCNYKGTSEGICADRVRNADGICPEPDGYLAPTDDESPSCSGGDNDCDGVADEGCACNFDGVPKGVCSNQTRDPDGTCPRPKHFEEGRESSCDDDRDNDCDGAVDGADPDCNRTAGSSCSDDAQCLSRCHGGECAHRIFVTSKPYDGNLGGLSGGDNKCNDIASNAGLSGSWRALLSSSMLSAKTRLSIEAPVFVGTRKVAAGRSEFWSANHRTSIDRDESGNQLSGTVWTGTNEDGTRDETGEADGTGEYCDDWQSADGADDGEVGDTTVSGSRRWCAGSDDACDRTRHLYCIDGQ